MIEKVVKFEGFNVTLRPLTVRAIITLINSLPELFSEQDKDVDATKNLSEIVIINAELICGILAPFVTRSDGKSISTLGDNIEALHDPFAEINPLFLPILSQMIHPVFVLSGDGHQEA